MILLLLNLAFAEELVPKDGAASLVRAIDGGGVYYPLDSGEVLEFDVVGPVELDIEARQRLPSSSVEFGLVTLSAQGDGMHILSIKVEGAADPTGTVMDGIGGIPTVMDQAQITVPAGEHVFTLAYDEGRHPVLVRVSVEGEMSPPATVPVAPEATVDVEEDPEEDLLEEDDLLEEILAEDELPEEDDLLEEILAEDELLEGDEISMEDFDLDEDVFDDDYFDDLDEDEFIPDDPDPVDELVLEDPDPVEDLILEDPDPPRVPAKRKEPDSLAAVRLGVGDTRAGTDASYYVGLEFLKPLTPAWGLSVRLGHYSISLDTQIPAQPAVGHYAGVTHRVRWNTRVRQLDTSLRRELTMGRLDLYAQAGAALYYSTRVYGYKRFSVGQDLISTGAQVQVPEPVSGASVGLSGAVGLDIPLGRGALAPEIAVHTGRRGFGNTSPSGDEAREPLSSAHLNLAYVVGF